MRAFGVELLPEGVELGLLLQAVGNKSTCPALVTSELSASFVL
jgi:hypothetical protein